MPDIMTADQRSERMGRVKSKDSKAELRVRSLVHGLGFRFRLHGRMLPGKPDIVLPRHRKVILVHGCFWHRHGVCRSLSVPTNNADFWREKFAKTIERDKRNIEELCGMGWNVLVIWECETRDANLLQTKLRAFLET